MATATMAIRMSRIWVCRPAVALMRMGISWLSPLRSPAWTRRNAGGCSEEYSDQKLMRLKVPGHREPFELEYRPDDLLPKSATSWHWSRPSRRWVTVTPIVLDHYPKRGDFEGAVRKSIKLAGLPKPTHVDVSAEAMTTGGVRLSPRELPQRARGRLYCHARITFDQPVTGPVLVGAGRYFGIGLLQPESLKEGDGDAA